MTGKKARKILFIGEGAVIAALVIILLVILHRPGDQSGASTEEGRAYIAAEEAKDPAQARDAIRQAKEAQAEETALAEEAARAEEEQRAAEERSFLMEDLKEQIDTLNIRELSPEEIAEYRQRLDTTVVVGDSMSQAVYDYGFLDENHVMFRRSESISRMADLTQEALEMLPERIIFFTGLGDVDEFAENPEGYYNAYLERVAQIQAFDPNIRIDICSLLPPSDDLAEWAGNLARSPLYDEQLRRLCNDTAANYLDNSWMVRQELYLEDGIHFNYDFYTIWIQAVAR